MNLARGHPFSLPVPRRRVPLAPSLLCVLLGMTACARPFPRDPEVMGLVEAITRAEQRFEWTNDTVVAPAAVADLIRRGSATVPTLLDVLPTITDSWTRSMLLEALGRIGDPRACEPLERMLARPTREIPDGVLPALVRLAQPRSIPALRALLARPDRGGFRKTDLLGALLRVGDESVLEPLIDRGMEVAEDTLDALETVDALVQFAPLRHALGMQEAPDFVEEIGLFLRAAKEWALEQRGQPSPWKASPDFTFQEPFAAEKQQAFERVMEAAGMSHTTVRCLPVDVTVADTTSHDPVAVLFGWGHAHNLYLDVWQPRGATVRLHRFSMRRGTQRSDFAEDAAEHGHESAEVPILTLQRALAGVRAACATRLVAWWQGSSPSHWMNTNDFAVMLLGANTSEATSAFCGYRSSTSLIAYPTLAAARDWHLRVADDCNLRPAVATNDDRRLFADFWQRSRERCSEANWWFVRERMIAMAGAFGDASLVPSLLDYVQPHFADGKHSEQRTAAHACTALAALTGIDLRFDDGGEPRPVADVAKAYRDRCAK